MSEQEKYEVEDIYINSFYIILRATDSQIQLSLNGEDIVKVNMSLITAKNLAIKLSAEIVRYENDLGVKIETLDEVQVKIDAFNLNLKQKQEQEQKDKEGRNAS
jgi:hypothetical protein